MTLKQYGLNHLEAFSQWWNVLHGGDPNVTFSSRCWHIREGTQDYWILPKWYWDAWLWFWRNFASKHLDWAMGDD